MSNRLVDITARPKVIPILVDDSASLASLYESDVKIYARSVSGWFNRLRWAMVFATQAVFYGLPWLQLNGRPALLFDLGSRRFYIFNWVLYPQDLIYLTGLLVMSALALFLFTAVAGRLWCGYTCPQTVYTEIFMWVERKIEGDRIARMRLDKEKLSFNKLARRTTKHGVWLAIGLWTGFSFVGYFTPIRELAQQALVWRMGPWELFWVLFYGLATYGNAGWMREQVCKYMCPYARFQSAMFDADTLAVTYDVARGEERGSRPRSDTPAQFHAKGLGDCIDCRLCVQVCPTGIDIRNGLQYECISCAACIDVCDSVMDKMHYPRGLIRNSSENAVAQNLSHAQMLRRILRPRVLIYTAALLILSTGMAWSLMSRAEFKVDVQRDRGAVARLVGQGEVENVYRLQIMNATEQAQTYVVRVDGLGDLHGVGGVSGLRIVSGSATLRVDAASTRWLALRVVASAGQTPGSHPITFGVTTLVAPGDEVVEKAVFVVPK